MNQLPLFEDPTPRIYVERSAGHRRGISIMTATVYDEEGFPIIFVECEGSVARCNEKAVLGCARQAFMFRLMRPFGDEYLVDGMHVSYLCYNSDSIEPD